MKEWLKVIDTRDVETGEEYKTSKLKIFKNCTTLIRNLPQLQIDDKNPSDASTEPHSITHICDSLRYYCVNYTRNAELKETIDTTYYMPSEIEDFVKHKTAINRPTRISRR